MYIPKVSQTYYPQGTSYILKTAAWEILKDKKRKNHFKKGINRCDFK